MVLQGPIPQLQNAQALPLLRAFVVAQKVNGRQHFRFEAGDWANSDPATGLPPDKGKHLLTAINTGRYHPLGVHVTVALLHLAGRGENAHSTCFTCCLQAGHCHCKGVPKSKLSVPPITCPQQRLE